MSSCAQLKLEFPVDWTYRILCENNDSVKSELQNVLDSMGKYSFEAGNISKSGKYISYKVIRENILSIEELRDLPQRLSSIAGIKQVL